MTAKQAIVLVSLILLLVAPFLSGGLITDFSNQNFRILIDLRIPRILCAFLVGGGLSMAGVVFQSLFRNPLAAPYTLGTASGAAFGAVVALGANLYAAFWIFDTTTLFSYLGSLLAIFTVYSFTKTKGRFCGETLLLSGVAVGLTFSSLILFVQYLNNDLSSAKIIHWLMGGIEVVGFEIPLKILLPTLLCSLYMRKKIMVLEIMSVGDIFGLSRGVDVEKNRLKIYLVISTLIAFVVAECGPIGFVGLMIPHITRNILKERLSKIFWFVFILGGSFLVFCDILSRTLLPTVIPLGVITSLFGGPFFLLLLYRRQ